jgi:REP element-mobilizing transposase RayT
MGVIAYHVIITNYGFWLPNDPRGSWSDYVRSWELLLAGGPATKVNTRRSVAGVRHDVALRAQAKAALVRPPVVFSGKQAQAVGAGFGDFVDRSQVSIVACSIMPRHTHLVIARPPYEAEQAANLLKGAATTELTRRGLHPFADSPYLNGRLPTPWARKQWIVFLNTEADVRRAIEYVERNPLKDGLKAQRWSFVVPFHV